MSTQQDFSTATLVGRKSGDAGSVRELSADVCIVGAGIAGVSAAVESARLGRSVILVDSLPALGGQSAHSLIGLFCGLYSCGSAPVQLTHGIADDILEELRGVPGAYHERWGVQLTIVYDEVILGRWIERTLIREGVTVILGALLSKVEVRDRTITGIRILTRHGEVAITAPGYIDASGDAALAWSAGVECRTARDVTVYGSHMASLEFVNTDALPSASELDAALRSKGDQYGLHRKQGGIFPLPARGIVNLNITHTETPLDPVRASHLAVAGKDQVDAAHRFLKETFPSAFAGSRIRAYGLPGIRQTRWIRGIVQVGVDDVRQGRFFPDSIGRTAWPLELHDTLEDRKWESFGNGHLHYIPLRCMLSPELDNYIAAGRCIDGDVTALSSIRVMGPCIATGAAAAHAMEIAGSSAVHAVDTAMLQERLRHNISSEPTV